MKSLLTRLRRLEEKKPFSMPIFRYGWLSPLPTDYAGDRHIVIVTREETEKPNIEWCEFEERIGPRPAFDKDGGFTVFLTR